MSDGAIPTNQGQAARGVADQIEEGKTMKFRHFLGLMILAVVATVGAVACGSSDEAAPTAETAPTGDAEAEEETADPPPVY